MAAISSLDVKNGEMSVAWPVNRAPYSACWSGASAKLAKPTLVLQGERDYQVTMVDFANWKKALGASPFAKLKTYPKLNHLLIAGEGQSGPDEYMLPGHVDEAVVKDVAEWIVATKP